MSEIERERRAALGAALIQPRPDLGVLVVTGADRQRWLNGLVTCDLAALQPGGGAYGLCVLKTGRILTELWVLAAADRLFVAVPADRLAMVHQHLDRHLIMEDAEVADASAELAWVFTHGPRSARLVDLALAELGAPAAALVEWTGRGGSGLLVLPRAGGEAAEGALLAAAGEAGARVSDAGWEQLRIEWGVPRFGVDFDDQTLPQEASLEQLAVSFTKGCYLGQETVFMLEKRGHAKKRLVRLAVEGGARVAPGAPIALPDGTAVGAVTSAALEPREGEELALGYVKFKHAIPGAAVSVGERGARVLGLAGRSP